LATPTIDPVAVLTALGLSGSVHAEPVSGGADAAIWRVTHGDMTYALRVFRPEQAAVAQREVAAMTAAAGTIPVPRILAEGKWQDRPALLLDWMPGCPLWQELSRRPWMAGSLGLAFGRSQGEIHQIAAPAPLRGHPTPWINWADPDDALRSRLQALSQEHEVLLHLDYHQANVLVQDVCVSAVLDWANARVGDPRADLARTASILRFTPLAPGLPWPIRAAVRRAFVAGWRRGYRQVVGPVKEMAPFYAWAGKVMVRDLAPRVGRPDIPWLTQALLAEIQQWAEGWQRSGSP
jgi:aminoglycoside phosphotransferase (APT) family kinase protein